MAASVLARRQAKKLRLLTFWVETEDPLSSPWLRRAWARPDTKKKMAADLQSFLQEVERSGVHPEGITLANSEMSGGNDISLIYPWLHISASLPDISSWLAKQSETSTTSVQDRPKTHLRAMSENALEKGRDRLRQVVQGTFQIVESVLPSQELCFDAGEQLCVLLGFRTTDDNCVDTLEADSERSQEARSWREWTGIGTLYHHLAQLESVEVARVDFLEAHVPDHSAVFHYLVLLQLQVSSMRGKVGVLDLVARFRVRNMSGYVTVYTDLSPPSTSTTTTHSSLSSPTSTASSRGLATSLRRSQEERLQAKRQFFNER